MRCLKIDLTFLWRKKNRIPLICYCMGIFILFSAPILKAINLYWFILPTSTLLISLWFRYVTTDFNLIVNYYKKLGDPKNDIIDFIIGKNISSFIFLIPFLYIFFKVCNLLNISQYTMDLFYVTLKYTIISLGIENVFFVFNNKLIDSYTEEYIRKNISRDIEIGFSSFVSAIPTIIVSLGLGALYYIEKFNPSYIYILPFFLSCLSIVYFLRKKIYPFSFKNLTNQFDK